jgi:hypothetical protein
MTDSARALLGSSLYVALVVLPVFSYLKIRNQTDKKIVLSIFAIWLPWSAINTPIHEGAHALAGVLVGMQMRGGQFIQHFWKGDFVHGYVLWEPASVQQFLFSTSGPYLADFLITLFAFFFFPRRHCPPFVGALLLSVTYLRSLFDVVVNYTADTLFGGKGDFDFLLAGYPRIAVHAAAILIIVLSAAGAARELVLAHRLKPAIAAQVPIAG